MNTIPLYSSLAFNWKNGEGTADKSSLSAYILGEIVMDGPDFRNYVGVRSARTGLVEYFEEVHDEDGFDGEFRLFKNGNGHSLVIWNY